MKNIRIVIVKSMDFLLYIFNVKADTFLLISITNKSMGNNNILYRVLYSNKMA